MFTGIIEEIGTIRSVPGSGSAGSLRIGAKKVLEKTQIGDSIAVNGVCLTVTTLQPDGFTADVMPETLRRSNLGLLHIGDRVSLERAMAAEGRFGGHIVSGHIDGSGTISELRREENAIWITITAPSSIMELIVEKGSITIDGVSLTVAKVTDTSFSVSIIPHTKDATSLLDKKKGDAVNLENDIIGKYVKRLLGSAMGIPGSDLTGSAIDSRLGTDNKKSSAESRITEEFLREHGF